MKAVESFLALSEEALSRTEEARGEGGLLGIGTFSHYYSLTRTGDKGWCCDLFKYLEVVLVRCIQSINEGFSRR